MISTILLLFAFVLFVLAGLGVPSSPRVNFLGWGLACLTLYFIFERGLALR